jgi:hypothetical protein
MDNYYRRYHHGHPHHHNDKNHRHIALFETLKSPLPITRIIVGPSKNQAVDEAFARGRGFAGWISIEDGVEGMDQLVRSAAFLRRKITEHWG